LHGPCARTGFAEVAQVNGLTGRRGPVWIVFDFKPENEDGERTHYDEDDKGQL
jgi:hypothetical protein